jgi:RHS repeat-associated protein
MNGGHKVLLRISISLFIFSLVVMPLAPVWAEEAIAVPVLNVASDQVTEVNLNAPQESSSEDVSQISDSLNQTLNGLNTSPIGGEELLSGNDVVPLDMYSTRDNVGAKPKVSTNYGIDEFSGTFSYTVPIEFPQGRQNLSPIFSLNYNHQRSTIGTMTGYGWELTIPTIERDGRSGSDKLHTDNYFKINLGGSADLVPLSIDGSGHGTYSKRIESDFSNIVFNADGSWTVTDKLGVIYIFGSDSSSIVVDSNNSQHVYQWYLKEIRDTNDNYVRYEYTKDDNQVYPTRIVYTGHGNTDGIYEIKFQPFADGFPASATNVQSVSYRSGFSVETRFLLTRIEILTSGVTTRAYDIAYQSNTNGQKKLITSITPKAYKGAEESTKDITTFSYSVDTPSYTSTAQYHLPSGYVLGQVMGIAESKRDMFIDLNQDGFTDYIRLYCGSGTLNMSVFQNDTKGGWTSDSHSMSFGSGFTCNRYTSIPVAFAELNGDHKIDMITNTASYLNTGTGWTQVSGGSLFSLSQSTGPGQTPQNVVNFIDLNNDGYDDILYESHPTSVSTLVVGYIKTPGGGWIQDSDYTTSVTMGMPDCLTYGGSPMGYADLNRDGLQDVFYKYDCSFGSFSETAQGAYLNTGTGFVVTSAFGPIAQMSYLNGNASDPQQQINFISDYDRDGVIDVAGYYRFKHIASGSGRQSGGTLSMLGQTVFNTFLIGDSNYFDTTLPVALADLNGDQAQDVIHSGYQSDAVYLGSLTKPDIMKQINFQSGATAEIHYGYSADERDDAGNITNKHLPFSLYVAKEILVHDGLGNLTGTYYGYANGSNASYNQDFVQDVYGFGQVTKKTGQPMVAVDLGDGSDGAYISSGNDHWSTNKEFTSLTIQNGHTVTVDPGVTIRVQGLAQIDGVLTAKGLGYGGGGWWNGNGGDGDGPGKGQMGANFGSTGYGGGGAGYATAGENAPNVPNNFGHGGPAYGSPLLKPLEMGSGGGAGHNGGSIDIGFGGAGGGMIDLAADTVSVTGQINADGINGEDGMHFTTYSGDMYSGGGGGGSGGSIFIRTKNLASIGTDKVTARGGTGGIGLGNNNRGGDGSAGRIRIEAQTINGTSNPTYYSAGADGLSVNNKPDDVNLIRTVTDYMTAQQSGTNIDSSYYTHGRPIQTRTMDDNSHLRAQTNYQWQTVVNGSSTAVQLTQQTTASTDVAMPSSMREHDYDGNTLAIYHMDGMLGSAEKRGGIGVNSSYNLNENSIVYSAEGFNKRIDGAYRTPLLSTGNTFNLGNYWTVEFWFNVVTLPTGNYGFFQTAGNAPSSYHIGSGVGGQSQTYTLGIEITTASGPRPTVVTPFGIQQNRWYHLALVENGGSDLALYIDGMQVAHDTSAVAPALTSQTFNFGPGSGTNVPTLIDELRISNIARSAAEISSYFNAGIPAAVTQAQAAQYTYDTSNGNIVTEQNLGKGQLDLSTGSFTNITGDEKTTTYAYAQNTTKHILAAPKTKTIASATESKPEDFYYDQQAHGSVDKANLTKEDLKTNIVDIETTYNSYGLPLTKKDPKDTTAVSLSYDVNNLFVSTTTDALGRQTTTKYDAATGQLLYSRDPNGYQEKNTYDAFGRLTKKEVSDPNTVTTLITKQEISYQDTTFPNYVEVKDYFKSGSYTTSRQYYDGLGRVIQTVKSAAGGQYIVSYKQYDSQGRVAKETLPAFTNTISYNPAPSFSLAKTYTYDALDRVLTEVTPTGTTSYAYDGLVTTITDPRNKVKKLTKDAFDNLVKVEELNNGSTYTTTYEYTLTNKLKKITDALGNIRTFTYDDLDNLTQQDMIHKSSVTDPVKWTYTYDKNGNVLSKVDPKSQTTNYTYDSLNRLLQENFAGKTGIEYALTYDQGSGQLGRLTHVVGTDGLTIDYTYDKQGKPLTVTRTIDGTSYVLTYAYDWNGNVTSITYPEGERVDYLYNAAGQINQVNKVKNGVTTVLASSVTYSPLGQITHQQRGNNVTTDYTYDANQNYRLTRLRTVSGAVVLQDIAYTYDANGNILTLVDSSQTALAKSVAYTYDDLNRLTSATVTGSGSGANYTQTYTYDATGNMLTNSAVGTYAYTLNNPQQARTMGATTYTYDANGNVNYINQDHQLYDWRDRMYSSNLAGSTDHIEYLYDHTNQRVKKHTVVYVAPPGGGDCENHPDQCPDPIQGIPRVLPPEVTPAPGKLPIPILEPLPTPDGIEAGSEELGVGDLTTEASSTPEVSIQTVDSLSTDNLQLETDTTSTPPVLTVDPVEPLPIVSFELPTTTPDVIATSTDPIVLPDPVLIEPLATSTDVTSTTTALTIDPEITPNAAPASGDVVTYYIDKYYEKQWNGVARNHYFLGTINLALDVLSGTNTGVYYVLSDHLGSSSLTTNSFGNMIDRTEYAPYGSIVATAATQNIGNSYKFTGKEADSENNLQYFGARYYDNRVGKFTQIDPYSFRLDKIQNLLSNPQYLNGYSYSLNNPVVLVDPNGNLPIVVGFIWLAANPEAVILTAATAYSLYTAVKDWAQGVGYAIEGDTRTSQQYLNQSALDQSVALFSGAASLEAMPNTIQKTSPKSTSNTSSGANKPVQSPSQTLTEKAQSTEKPATPRPVVTDRSAQHIQENHLNPAMASTKSQFVPGEGTQQTVDDIFDLVNQPVVQDNNRLMFEADLGRTVGTHGQTTARFIMDPNSGEVITAHPINKLSK